MPEVQQYHAHSTIFLFAIRPYAFIEEIADCTQSVAFQVRSGFEGEDFRHGKAKICRNTRLFQGFSTQAGQKCSAQNHIDCCLQKYDYIVNFGKRS